MISQGRCPHDYALTDGTVAGWCPECLPMQIDWDSRTTTTITIDRDAMIVAAAREIIAELDRLNGYGSARMVPLYDAIEECRSLFDEDGKNKT